MKSKNLKHIIFYIIVSFICLANVFAQNDTAENKSISKKDSAQITDTNKVDTSNFSAAIDLMRDAGEKAIQKMVLETKEKQIHSKQMILIDKLDGEYNKIEELFKRGIDTVSIIKDIDEIEKQYNTAIEGTESDSDILQTLRNLNTSSLLLMEIDTRLDRSKKKAEYYLDKLIPLKNSIDSIQNDSALYFFSTDSSLFVEYFNKLIIASTKLSPIDSGLNTSIKNLNDIISNINNLSGKVKTSIELIEENKNELSGNMFSAETSGLFDPYMSNETFADKMEFSKTKGNLVLNYYLSNNSWRLLLLFFTVIILIYFTYRVRKRYSESFSEKKDLTELVFNHPVLSPVFVCLTLFQFIFPHPPVFFSGILWTISTLILTFILWKYFSVMQRVYWSYFVLSVVAVLYIDLQLKETIIERWAMLIISLTGIAAGIIVIRKNILKDENRKLKFLLLIIALLLLAGSVVTNISGRYNLSKIYITLCFFGMLTAYLLYWTWILVTQLLNVSTEVYKLEGNQNFKDRIHKLRSSVPVYLKLILIIGWLILIARNFYFYERISNEINLIIEKETSVGDFTFTLEKLILFFFIIMLSAAISKMISLFSDRFDDSEKNKEGSIAKAGGLSNWMLLIRIAVITLGTLLAFAATGIPIDKMTIIIGSLGVGIGLGLQSIVNNLVSGIILAFEKPFKIGDYIDVSNESGRIKEIGIRSSKISTSEGADIIIPNGDLLSKHVINWTLRNSMKRSELNLNIKYGTHLNEIITIFKNTMDSNDRIEKYPEPEVLLHQFGSGSAEYRLLYWTHLEFTERVKSELIVAIEGELKKAGIDLA